jgi:hypothetical protein
MASYVNLLLNQVEQLAEIRARAEKMRPLAASSALIAAILASPYIRPSGLP